MYPNFCFTPFSIRRLPRSFAGITAIAVIAFAGVSQALAGVAPSKVALPVEDLVEASPEPVAVPSAVTAPLPVPSTPTRYDFFEAAGNATGSLTVTWRTVYERGLVSFDLWRRIGGGVWTRVNADPVTAFNSMVGGLYRATDPTPAGGVSVEYKLVEFNEAGASYEYGPITLRVVPEPTPLSALVPPPPRREPKSMLVESVPPVSGTNGTRYAKFQTSAAGLYCVRADTLASQLGQPLATVQQWLLQGTVGLYSRGQAVGFVPAADGSALYFYATSYADNYGSQNVFWLTALTNPVPPVVSGGAPAPVTNLFDQARFFQETNILAAPSTTLNPEDDYWYWKQMVSVANFNTYSLTVPLSLVVTNAGYPRLKVWLFGGASTNHGASVTVNGNLAGTNIWSGLSTLILDLPLQPAWLKSGNNTLLFTASTAFKNSKWYLNKLELYYPRVYQATAGMLEFTANSNQVVTVEGFTSSSLSVLDVTDPLRPALVSNFTVAPSGGNFSLSLTATNPQTRFVAFQAGASVPQPTTSAVVLAGLASTTNAVDFVLIAPAFLAATAENLASYRRGQGLASRVVTVESIYNEFNDGIPSPYSLREFLAFAHTNYTVRPRYVALIGDGSFDYRNLLGYDQMQVPTLMLPTSIGLYASDSLLSDFNSDNIPEMGLGRLPVRNTTQLQTMISKIMAYEAAGIRTNSRVLLAADFPDGAGNFVQDLQFVSQTLSNKYDQAIVLPTTTAEVRAGMISNLNVGVDLMVYLGHGALDRFGQAGYLVSTDTTNLFNGSRLPLVSVMTCVAGEYSQPGNNCIGEELVLASNRGAIAVIGPTGLSSNQDATLLNQRLMRILRTQDWGRLGDYWRQAAADYSQYDQRPMGVSIYNLIGDPSLKFSVSRDAPPPRRK